MKTNKMILLGTALATAFALCFPKVIKADSITLTRDSANLTVAEGDTATASFTFTNNSGQKIVIPETNWGQKDKVQGDSSDTWNLFNSSSTIGNCLSNDMASGTSCSFTVDFGTFSDSGEVDADFGVTPMYASLSWCYDTGQPAGSCSEFTITEADFNLVVLDPGASPPSTVPEPSSVLLLGAGLLGLAGALRRWRTAA